MSKLLFNSQPLVVDPDLAILVGLNEAIIIQQVHYWIEINKKANRNFHDDRYWTYNTLKEWHKNYFPFWSFNTVHRTILKLEEKGILLVGSFSKNPSDRTKWYTINYEALDELNNEQHCSKEEPKSLENKELEPYPQNEHMPPLSSKHVQDQNDCSPISPKWGNAYPQNGEIYLLTENNYTEINSIYPSDNLNTKQGSKTYVKKMIGYDGFMNSEDQGLVSRWIDNIVDLIAEVFVQKTGTIKISGLDRNVEEVKNQFSRLNQTHILYLVHCLESTKPDVRNIKSYLLTSLYNAPNTDSSFFATREKHESKILEQEKSVQRENELRKKLGRKL